MSPENQVCPDATKPQPQRAMRFVTLPDAAAEFKLNEPAFVELLLSMPDDVRRAMAARAERSHP